MYTYDLLASDIGIRDISNCSFNLSFNSSNFRSLASAIACFGISITKKKKKKEKRDREHSFLIKIRRSKNNRKKKKGGRRRD